MIKKIILPLISLIFLSWLTAFAIWFEPSNTAPFNNPYSILTTSNADQSKLGGLEINSGGSILGLLVSGGSGSGLVGIGQNPPTEKLDIDGNFKISGIIKPNGDTGTAGSFYGEYLTFQNNSMDWTPDLAEITIHRIDRWNGSACVRVFPNCPSGWVEEVVLPSVPPACSANGGLPIIYGLQRRVCYKNF